jgi:Cu/Ag efflux protein CusF
MRTKTAHAVFWEGHEFHSCRKNHLEDRLQPLRQAEVENRSKPQGLKALPVSRSIGTAGSRALPGWRTSNGDEMKKSKFLELALLALVMLAILITGSCNKDSAQPTVTTPRPVPSVAKRYHLKGKVVSVDKQAKMVNVDSEAIPDFMGAMTMPYTVKPEGELDKLSTGDAITADVVAQDDKYWLENITVTGHSPAPASK